MATCESEIKAIMFESSFSRAKAMANLSLSAAEQEAPPNVL